MPRDMLSPPAAPTLEGLIEFLKIKDPTGEYCYADNEGCLIFQFLQHLGYPVASVCPDTYRLEDGSTYLLPYGLNAVAIVSPYIRRDNKRWQTFGMALQEALYLQGQEASL